MSTTIESSDMRFRITLHIEFENRTDKNELADQTLTPWSDEAFKAQMELWARWIEDFWNGLEGSRPWQSCRVEFRVDWRVKGLDANPTPQGQYHQIEVVRINSGSWASLGPAPGTGQWEILDDKEVVAHEAGHLLGLRDEYGADETHEDEDQTCIMLYADVAADPVVLPVHIDEIVGTIFQKSCESGGPGGCFFLPASILAWLRWVRWKRQTSLVSHVVAAPPPPGSIPPDDADLDALITAVRTQHLDPALASVRILRTQLREGAVSVETVAARAGGAPLLDRWLVVMALAATPGEASAEVLRRMLGDEDVNIRLRAAEGLAALSERAGVPVLIEALGSRARIMGHPPVSVATRAVHALRRFTGQDFGFDPRLTGPDREKVIAKWRAWWEENPEAPIGPR